MRHLASPLVVLLVLTATAKSAPPQKAEMVELLDPAQRTFKDRSGKVSITMPAKWQALKQIRRKKPPVKEGYETVLDLVCSAEKVDGQLKIYVTVINGGALRPLAGARWDVQVRRPVYGKSGHVEWFVNPYLHSIGDDPKKSSIQVCGYRRFGGRLYTVELLCLRDQWGKLYSAFGELVAALRSELEPWPARVAGRHELTKEGILISAKDSGDWRKRAKVLQTCALAVQKCLVKRHGAVPRPEGELCVIYLNGEKKDHAEILGVAVKDDFELKLYSRRMFAVPIDTGAGTERRRFIRWLSHLLLTEIYGADDEYWVITGEGQIQAMRDATGRKLPYITERFDRQRKPPTKKLIDVRGKSRGSDWNAFWLHSTCYVALFHAGPSKYQKAYKAYLADLRRTCDPKLAFDMQIASLDQDALLAAAQKFCSRKMKRAKPR